MNSNDPQHWTGQTSSSSENPQKNLHHHGQHKFKKPELPRRTRRLRREEREECYSRMESLTKDLRVAIQQEMARRKEDWDSSGDKEEEAFWEDRKKAVYKGLEDLADDIQRALRDRKKEAVLALWSMEENERNLRRMVAEGGPAWRSSRPDGDA